VKARAFSAGLGTNVRSQQGHQNVPFEARNASIDFCAFDAGIKLSFGGGKESRLKAGTGFSIDLLSFVIIG
jgi:hypothetical protein